MENNELASLGIQAYQCGDYETAINMLQQLTARDSQLWTCRLYLAMAYQHNGQTTLAKAELTTISDWTTDASIRAKALACLRAINLLRPSVAQQKTGAAKK